MDTENLRIGRRRLLDALTRFHEREPLRLAIGRPRIRDQLAVSEAVLDALIEGGADVEKVDGGRLKLRTFSPTLSGVQAERRDRIEALLGAERFTPPRESEIPSLIEANPAEAAKLLDLLVDDGRVVRIGDGVILLAEALEEAKREVRAFLGEHGALAPSDLKEMLGMSRKYSIPLLEWMDACRFTVRRGDRRELG